MSRTGRKNKREKSTRKFLQCIWRCVGHNTHKLWAKKTRITIINMKKYYCKQVYMKSSTWFYHLYCSASRCVSTIDYFWYTCTGGTVKVVKPCLISIVVTLFVTSHCFEFLSFSLAMLLLCVLSPEISGLF